jgi:hypothetical protein
MGVGPVLLIVGFVMLPSEFGFLYCFLLIVSVVLFLLVVGHLAIKYNSKC